MAGRLPGIAGGLPGTAGMGDHGTGVMNRIGSPFPRQRQRAGQSLRPSWACLAGRASEALCPRGAAFPSRPLRPTFAGRALRACLAITAIANHGQPVGDHALEGAEFLGKSATQFGHRRLRLCFDQCAFTLPRSTFGVEHFSQRLAPDVKQKVGGVRIGRHWQKGF